MDAPQKSSKVDPTVVAGFAVGVGLTFVATLGVYWHYWQPSTSPWLWAPVTFAVGALLGAGWAVWRKARL